MSEKPKTIPNYVKFAFGGLSGMGATLFVQPLDLVKTRMQLSAGAPEYNTTFKALRTVIGKEGFFKLYTGLSAGLARQASYTTTRLGVYTWLFEITNKKHGTPNFFMKAALGMTAGAVGSFAGNPTEVALIRMTGDGRLPPEQRRNYKNVFDAIFRITKEEGVLTLWRGCTPTIMRAMVVNAAQLATYSQSKQMILNSKIVEDGIFCHFLASMISGLATTIVSMPVDIVKTRIQSMRIVDGIPEYSGMGDVLKKVISKEGFFALWKGFTPYYMRLGPHTVITFIILEQMNSAYNKHILGVKGKAAL
ncbi:Mitochondrial 2-oxoglutarate/malate carrier protein [Strongyloides ratti]|uniref:Mitochondrial 2-oxoglutarate/malate carrier protein n=1 Tax=Strongyloides ratti TaxID=34506 RepID=A0A090LRC9_STRRB|nr:Mitochondrial 2-oxoglutarate/malate carrier protein [Strongyloides ratti]CEF70692.1 Mitochondrial 2-oxoglutarate/malate carrier protein [Strongyloides ratti]